VPRLRQLPRLEEDRIGNTNLAYIVQLDTPLQFFKLRVGEIAALGNFQGVASNPPRVSCRGTVAEVQGSSERRQQQRFDFLTLLDKLLSVAPNL
jgi:hypothetical protein